MEQTAEATIAETAFDPPAETSADTLTAADTLIEDELLVEEISIDGMCGVY